MEIPGYDIQRLVAQGGTSSVFVAVQRSLGRQVALKILRPLDGSAFTARFLEEGRVIASLNHRNVITIHDVGVLGGWYYIAMEYLEGGSLESRVNGGMPPAEALEILETVAGCLDFVHRRGLIHRDIKPANILFHADGSLRLTDFGIAKQLSADQDLTLDGRALGSPYYLSPEQAECKPLDGRSDIYSLGIVFYELLTGRKPFAGASHIETILAHLTRPVPMLPGELRAFQALLGHMIAKSPSQRFASARELAEDVGRLRSSVSRAAAGPQAPSLPWRGSRQTRMAGRRLRSLSSMAPVAVLLAVTAGLVGYRAQQADDVEVASPGHPAVTTETAAPVAAGQVEERPAPDAAGNDPGAGPVGETGEPVRERDPAETDAGLAMSGPAQAVSPVPTTVRVPVAAPMALDPGDTPMAVPRAENSLTEQEARVAQWLRLASEAIRDYRLTTPRHDSARFYYRAVLDQDPGNEEAVAGLGRVADTYAALARRKLAEQDRDAAKTYVERGLSIRPRHRGLLALEKALAPPAVAVVEAPEVDAFTGFLRKVRAFMTDPSNKPNTELLNQ